MEESLKRKIIIISIAILILVLYIGVAYFGNKEVNKVSNSYLIVGDYLIWHNVGDKFYQLKEVPLDINKYEFTVYNGNKKTKGNNAQYNSGIWYMYNNNYVNVVKDNFNIAFSSMNVVPADYEEETYSDEEDLINEVAGNPDYTNYIKFQNSLKKIVYDFDNDGEDEELYTFSDNTLDAVDYTPRSYMVLMKNGKLNKVETSGQDRKFVVQNILDLDGDGSYEIIVSNNVINKATFKACYQIYKVQDGRLALYQSCLYED